MPDDTTRSNETPSYLSVPEAGTVEGRYTGHRLDDNFGAAFIDTDPAEFPDHSTTPDQTTVSDQTSERGRAGPVAHRGHRLVALTLVATLALVAFGAVMFSAGKLSTVPGPATVTTPGASGEFLAEKVYEAAAPSVVSITAGDSTGSGFFYKPGKVVTNAHVISGSGSPATGSGAAVAPQKVKVRLHDGRIRDGRVEAVDPLMDIAVVSVVTTDVPPLAFADSATLRPGQPVVAIGAPLDMPDSVSVGVVSSPHRATTFRENPVQAQLIQTDAAVNPGNSGGPLLDTTGKVTGIITIRPDEIANRPVQGISFAVPSRLVTASVFKLERDGAARYVLLGVSGRSSTPDDKAQGLFVEQVTAGGAAAKAGVKLGDVITAIDGTKTPAYDAVTDQLLNHNPGDVVTVTVFRDGRTVTTHATLIERTTGQ
jgi:putative serine protease PepD